MNYPRITKLNPSISTENLGDYIIEDYCDKTLKKMFGEYMGLSVPTRDRLSRLTRRKIATADIAFVYGTNILSSRMNKWKQWNISLLDALLIRCGDVRKKDLKSLRVVKEKYGATHVVLMGAGWLTYQDAPNWYTVKLLRTLLDTNYLHSVRDSYTERMLRSIGIENVINTACPTMWGLTREHCSRIPTQKGNCVVTTLTDYRKNNESDQILMEILLRSYDVVYVWLQSMADMETIRQIGVQDKVHIIPPTLSAYDSVLERDDIDYIGTRLHGGIRALNKKKRTLILAVDNRAKEIASDTHLPVMDRKSIADKLEEWIRGDHTVDIKLPEENIRVWKSQFDKNCSGGSLSEN